MLDLIIYHEKFISSTIIYFLAILQEKFDVRETIYDKSLTRKKNNKQLIYYFYNLDKKERERVQEEYERKL